MEIVMFYGVLYLICALVFLFCTAIIRGYNTQELIWNDAFDALIWPFSIGVLLGLLLKVLMIKVFF